MTLEQAELQGTTTLVYFIYRISPMQWEMSASVRFSSYILFSFSVPNVGWFKIAVGGENSESLFCEFSGAFWAAWTPL